MSRRGATVDDFWLRSDECDARSFYFGRKLGILREEAIARMDHVDAMLECDSDDVVLGEIGGDRSQLFADDVCLVCLVAMRRESIFLGVDGDGLHSKFVSLTEDGQWQRQGQRTGRAPVR